jgi:inosine-uridine nucleoside N-ribohydrolase
VDDGFALAAVFCAAAAGGVRVAGVSTVFGNTSARSAEACARKLATAAGVEVPVWRGAEGPGGSSGAAERIAELPEGFEILALGPLTNLAAALAHDPGLPARTSLRLVGGNLSSRGFLTPLWPLEFNLTRDAEAARQVLSAGWRRMLLYPLDVVCRMRADSAQLSRLSGLSGLGAFLASGSERWLRRARWRHLSRSFPVWDLPCALEALGLLRSPTREGRLRLRFGPFSGNMFRLEWVTALDSNRAWASFEQVLLAQPRPGPLIHSRQEVS